jgi:hypothetical protein
MDDPERDRHRQALRQQPESFGARAAATVRRRVRQQAEEGSEPTSWVLNLILLIVLCVVVMAIATAALRQWRPAPLGPTLPTVVIPTNAERAAARSDASAAQDLEKEARIREQQLADQRRAEAMRQREAEEEAALRAAALNARREREWQAYYKKPPYCDDTRPDIDSVGCANDYIRARRAFDAQFTAGNRR